MGVIKPFQWLKCKSFIYSTYLESKRITHGFVWHQNTLQSTFGNFRDAECRKVSFDYVFS